ncbi:protein UPSTREAM OF FLC-like [Canna indica]|uniref:Protein UPSTREAM OF FLC-like n=1 Tax=Canna indica TaxID=4628 RepID=A0AAQ3KWF8_9LILI|nr:protein UPSTREAM OF FLC-like [Canna indica]
MAVPFSRGRPESLRHWRDRDTSPERTMVWKEPKPSKVPVVYYLSRNGQLEHPHFMEVTLSSTGGLYLRDVIDRLNFLRGKGMANLYSWSSRRSYKNGFVWQDLSEDDLIHPVHSHEYVLKGSELLRSIPLSRSSDSSAAFFASENPLHFPKSAHEIRRSRAHWSSFDLHEYKVYKTDVAAETAARAADASTQTDDGSSRLGETPRAEEADPPTTVLEREDISPPPSSSSTENLETPIKTEGRASGAGAEDQDRPVVSYAGGRMRASAMLMHLLSCGSINVKGQREFSVSPAPRQCAESVMPRGRKDLSGAKETECLMEGSSFPSMRMEDKDWELE